ncbi:MAG: hypothetical protein GC164_09375 [Phycisphaera sp.]|nr:hypothetical protein [Phycisphaera sp.]
MKTSSRNVTVDETLDESLAPLTAEQATLAERERHQRVVKTVFEWLAKTHATQQKLVQLVEEHYHHKGDTTFHCDHAMLSRILNPVAPYIPTARRKRAVQILTALSVICSRPDDANLIQSLPDNDHLPLGDDEQAFVRHRARLRQVRERFIGSPYEALHFVGEFCAVASWMDDQEHSNDLGESLRQRAVENTLMTLASIVDSGAVIERLADRLERAGLSHEEAVEVERKQVERIERLLESLKQPGVNAEAYAGAALFFLDQNERGMTMLQNAVGKGVDAEHRHDMHWETLLDLLERLLKSDHADATRWTKQALQIAQRLLADRPSPAWELLHNAWYNVEAPHVRELWTDRDPNVTDALDATQSPVKNREAAANPPHPVRKVGVIASMILGALLLLPGLAQSSIPTHTTGVQSQAFVNGIDHRQASIRGREASSGDPGPSTGSPDSVPA